MFTKLIARVKSMSRRTKCLLVQILIIVCFTATTMWLACNSECGHVVREKMAEGILGGVCVGMFFAAVKLLA